jgi:hypothetical protein
MTVQKYILSFCWLDFFLLGYDAMPFCKWMPKFRSVLIFKGQPRISSSSRTKTPHSLETMETPIQWWSVISQKMEIINYASLKNSVFTDFGSNFEWGAGSNVGPLLHVISDCNVIQKGFMLLYMAPNRVLLRQAIRSWRTGNSSEFPA